MFPLRSDFSYLTMESLSGKVALVTGASSGIGADIAKALVMAGMKVVGVARRKERIDKMAKELVDGPGKLFALKADMSKEEDITEAFKWTTKNVGPLHVLINNAGVVQACTVKDGDANKWQAVLGTNVLGLTIASREAIKIMSNNGIDGYIVQINSIAGHVVVDFPGIAMYTASKHAVTAITESIRLELIRMGSKIRITSVSPGFVDTDIFLSNNMMSPEEYATLKNESPSLRCEDITNAVLYVLSTPKHVQVTELTILPTADTVANSSMLRT